MSVGQKYQIGLDTYPGSATGGIAFSPQPVVTVQDKGGNTVTSVNSGSVTASISTNPTGADLLPVESLTVNFTSGAAFFSSLKIDIASNEAYILEFTTNLV